MFKEEIMKLNKCVQCKEEIAIGKKAISVFKDLYVEYWVHAGKCLDSYKDLLNAPDAIIQGAIVGVCEECLKPVRRHQKDAVGLIPEEVVNKSTSETLTFLSYPDGNDVHYISFMHKECVEK